MKKSLSYVWTFGHINAVWIESNFEFDNILWLDKIPSRVRDLKNYEVIIMLVI